MRTVHNGTEKGSEGGQGAWECDIQVVPAFLDQQKDVQQRLEF
jgi:hypothetical protein